MRLGFGIGEMGLTEFVMKYATRERHEVRSCRRGRIVSEFFTVASPLSRQITFESEGFFFPKKIKKKFSGKEIRPNMIIGRELTLQGTCVNLNVDRVAGRCDTKATKKAPSAFLSAPLSLAHEVTHVSCVLHLCLQAGLVCVLQIKKRGLCPRSRSLPSRFHCPQLPSHLPFPKQES